MNAPFQRLEPGRAAQLRRTFSRTGKALIVGGIAIWFVTALLAYAAVNVRSAIAAVVISSGSVGGLLALLSGINMMSLRRLMAAEWADARRVRTGQRVLLLNLILALAMAVIVWFTVLALPGSARTPAALVALSLLLPVASCGLAAIGFFVARTSLSQIMPLGR